MASCYAFDSDNTLNLPGMKFSGPIDTRDVVYLKNQGNVVGLCGNYYIAMKCWGPEIWKVINFWGPLHNHDKATFLATVKMDIARTQPLIRDFCMVGNRRADAMMGLVLPDSQDDAFARLANWRFLSETEFAMGRR